MTRQKRTRKKLYRLREIPFQSPCRNCRSSLDRDSNGAKSLFPIVLSGQFSGPSLFSYFLNSSPELCAQKMTHWFALRTTIHLEIRWPWHKLFPRRSCKGGDGRQSESGDEGRSGLRPEIRPEVVGGSHFHGSSNQRGGIKFVLGGRIENGMEGNRGKEASPTSTQKIMFVNLPHFETFQAQLWNSKNKRL